MDEIDIINHAELLAATEKEIRAKNYVASEKEVREKLFNRARGYGRHIELSMIFAKYDNLLKNCTNEKERQHISILGQIEIYKLFEDSGPLISQGFEIIKGEK
jgi:hypothetical protein